MPVRTMSLSRRLVAASVLWQMIACAEPDPADLSQSDELVESDDPEERTSALGCPRGCTLSAASPAESAIWRKWDELDGFMRDMLASSEATPVSVTPNGEGAYQFYAGPWGRSAIYYSPRYGAHWVYGPILEAWAGKGYERSSFGFPASDAYDTYGGMVRQDFQSERLGEPDPTQGCLIETVRYFEWATDSAEVRSVEQRWYMDHNDRDRPSMTPQPSQIIYTRPLRDIFNEGFQPTVWCGPPPAWETDPNWQEPPDNGTAADPRDI